MNNNQQDRTKIIVITSLIVLVLLVIGLGGWYIVNAPEKNTQTNTETSVGNLRVQSPVEVVLSEGGTAQALGLSLTMNKFVQDNRCAVDEKCAEYGSVTVEVTLKYNELVETRNIAMDEVPYEFQGYAISIVGVKPDRLFGKNITNKDYQITFRVAPTAQGENI